MKSGNSKISPNAKSILVEKLKYSRTEGMGLIRSEAYPRKKSNPKGNTMK
jgi:hypothetical protein